MAQLAKIDDSPKAGILYVAATPIGHMDDCSVRLRTVLAEVDWLIAEDTRISGGLLSRLGISGPKLLSMDHHSEQARCEQVLAHLLSGSNLCLVTDAGTPAISDPGALVVAAARSAGINVVPIPGPSAIVALASVAGDRDGRFLFEGFLPASQGKRKKRLLTLKSIGWSAVLFEAPHRIVETSIDLVATWGPETEVLVGREMTKRHEQFWRGQAEHLPAWLESSAEHRMGEFAIYVYGSAARLETDDPKRAEQEAQAIEWLKELVPAIGTNGASKLVAKRLGLPKSWCYENALKLA